jgi:hypothetical protein
MGTGTADAGAASMRVASYDEVGEVVHFVFKRDDWSMSDEKL